MSTFGIIFVGYNCADLIQRSLTPWVEAKRGGLGGHTYLIAAVSVPFLGFEQPPEPDSTHSYLHQSRLREDIDHVIMNHVPVRETEARGAALKWLVEQRADYLWQVDSDEIYTQDNIARIANTVLANPFMAWWRLSFRNIVFTEFQWLAECFTPPRLHKVLLNRFRATEFWDDNNILYCAVDDGEILRDIDWAAFTIPANIAAPAHYSWLNNDRSRRKIDYQNSRGWSCGYRWDINRGLCFNEEYYIRRGLPLPEVITGK